jgi:thymidylate synthase (FAD)
MEIVSQSVKLLTQINDIAVYKLIERIGRVCYKSEHRATEGSYRDFIRNIILKEHFSVLEHVTIAFSIVTDRGVSHELVRHRIGIAISQESQRYCNYVHGIQFVEPADRKFLDSELSMLSQIESQYRHSLSAGLQPQQARAILPNCTKTELIITANIREWLHIIKLRTAVGAHPQMRALVQNIELILKEKLCLIF